jgi:acyl carrier protein
LWFRTNAGFWNWLRTCRRPGTRLYDGQEVEAWREQVIATVVGMTELTTEQVRSKIPVEDLVGADSLDIVELVMQLEDDFKRNGEHS